MARRVMQQYINASSVRILSRLLALLARADEVIE